MPLNRYTLNTRTLNGPYVPDTVEYPDALAITFRQQVVFRKYPDALAITFSQRVVETVEYPDALAITFRQSVVTEYPDALAITFRQRVYDDSVPLVEQRQPPAYVYIDGVQQRCTLKIDDLNVTHTEDSASTASIVLMYERNAPINIPSLNGKSLRIEIPEDQDDFFSPSVTVFNGVVERSTYDRQNKTVNLTGTTIRGERLGDEDPDDLLQLTQAVYSEVTQRQDATGEEFVSEMMRTVSGSLNYDKAGDLLFYTWGTDGKPVNRHYTGYDVQYENIGVEYQTRSSIVNTVQINISYRYTGLRTVQSSVEGVQQYQEWGGKYAGSFLRDTIIDRVENGFSPWLATSYELVDMPTVRQARERLGALLIYRPNPYRCMGYRADLERYIAQPVTEQYTLTVQAPQSVRAYGKPVRGSELTFSVDANADFDRAEFEDRDAVYTPTTKSSPNHLFEWPTGGTIAKYRDPAAVASYLAPVNDGTLPVLDTKRPLFSAGLLAATLIARKAIAASHRSNYIDFEVYRIDDIELGQVVALTSKTLSAVGQVTGITYSINSRTGRRTQIKMQVSSMNDDGPVPVEDWTAPAQPTLTVPPSPDVIPAPRAVNALGSVNFNRAEEVLDVNAPEVPETYTDEGVTEVAKTYEMALENQPIELYNRW